MTENESSFLQSWEWGIFQEKLGRKIWRLQVGGSSAGLGQVLLQAQVIKILLPFGKSYLYIPFGPCFGQNLSEEQKEQAFELLLGELKKISASERAVYCCIEPFLQKLHICKEFNSLHKPQKRIQPQKTLVLDLTKTNGEILAGFNEKTRYNVRLAAKKGVQFVVADADKPENLEIFYSLLKKTSQRDDFHSYPKSYFAQFLKFTEGSPRGITPRAALGVKLFFAQWQEKVIAANLLVLFGSRATNLHGASDYEFRQVKAPQFLRAQQIFWAKQQGFSQYDQWGIDEVKWPSLTEYKKSFGGKEIVYPAGFDIVFQPGWYKLFKLARKILRK
ncbi:MAG: aminoacyltransferase [Patescibacteria group bacterium]|nr:aminoacyltransferase [Patescibacteria group bacterium]